MLAVAADLRVAAGAGEIDHGDLVDEWMRSVGSGVAGYQTPKVAIGAVVGNDAGEILLVQRADSGVWLYPTGWADIGYSASEVALKEVREETGIDAEVVRPIMLLDGLRLGFTRLPLYSIVFHCRAVGGELAAHPSRRPAWDGSPSTTCRTAGGLRPLGSDRGARDRRRDVGLWFDPPRLDGAGPGPWRGERDEEANP